MYSASLFSSNFLNSLSNFSAVNILLLTATSFNTLLSDSLADITSLIGGIEGSLTSALSFVNLSLNIFGCELKPNVAVSDYYTFAKGGEATPDSEQPSAAATDSAAQKQSTVASVSDVPYAEPTKGTENVTLSDARTTDQVVSSTSGIA